MSLTTRGPTPSGGDRTTAIMRDADGREVHRPSDAATVEAVELAPDGTVLARTYLRRGEPQPTTWGPPADSFSDPVVSEAVKGTWDIYASDPDGSNYRLATTLADLLAALGLADAPLPDQRRTLATAMTWDSWAAAPAGLQHEVSEWLIATRPAS